ncbi:nucleosome assembly protein nap1 [Sparganum proliferum]
MLRCAAAGWARERARKAQGNEAVSEDGDDEYDGSVGEGVIAPEKLQAITEQPAEVKRRVKALKKLLHKAIGIETEYYQEIFEIEKKYEARYADLWDMRKKIISAAVEPTDEDCEWPFDDDLQELQLAASLSSQAQINKNEKEDGDTSKDSGMTTEVKGIPKFWLKVLLHNSLTSEMITDNDQPILSHLDDVRCKLVTDDESGFVLEFHFSPNEYFSNECLTKQYFFNQKPPADNPLDYDGPEISRCNGCTINWKPGKNVTIKVMKKVKKHKNRKDVRTVTKTVKRDSFFNFFDPPKESLTEPDLDEEVVDLLHEDFKIGHHLREYVIPRAVLFFTGEALETDLEDDDDDEDEDNDDFDNDEVDSDDGEDDNPKLKQQHPRTKKGGSNEKPPECQQS